MRALLALEDGSIFSGRAVGALRDVGGEVVFNTSMAGYQEILTDPSYHGQIIVFTAPELGNYGIHEQEDESLVPRAAGLIAREVCEHPSHPRARISLGGWLKENDCVGLAEVDTRALTLHLRRQGALRGWLTTHVESPEDAVTKARGVPPMEQVQAVPAVTTHSAYQWHELAPRFGGSPRGGIDVPGPRVVVLDYGVKFNILRQLARRGCQVTVLPADAEPAAIQRLSPDGVVLSNGPGDPGALQSWLPRVAQILERHPTLAICLGHQLASLALGCRIVRLPFGHHGGNHPVKNLATQRVLITAQNHNYAVDPTSLSRDLTITHLNLNDGTVEGLRHDSLPLWSLQFHPEASPGPHEAAEVFDEFVGALRSSADSNASTANEHLRTTTSPGT